MIIYLDMTYEDFRKFRRLYPIQVDAITGEYYFDSLDSYFVSTRHTGLPLELVKYIVNPKDAKQFYNI